jgi:hypothetical protein
MPSKSEAGHIAQASISWRASGCDLCERLGEAAQECRRKMNLESIAANALGRLSNSS